MPRQDCPSCKLRGHPRWIPADDVQVQLPPASEGDSDDETVKGDSGAGTEIQPDKTEQGTAKSEGGLSGWREKAMSVFRWPPRE